MKRTFYILWLENVLVVHHRNILMATPSWESQSYFNELFTYIFNAINCCLLIFKVDIILQHTDVYACVRWTRWTKCKDARQQVWVKVFRPKKNCIYTLQCMANTNKRKQKKMAPISNLIAILDNIVTSLNSWLRSVGFAVIICQFYRLQLNNTLKSKKKTNQTNTHDIYCAPMFLLRATIWSFIRKEFEKSETIPCIFNLNLIRVNSWN